MSGLSQTERDGFRDMFLDLPLTDLLALSDTVTNKKVSAISRKAAVETILSYTQNAEELLKRKKVTRDLIFTYLRKQKVIVSPSADKSHLTWATIDFWRSSKVYSGNLKSERGIQSSSNNYTKEIWTTSPTPAVTLPLSKVSVASVVERKVFAESEASEITNYSVFGKEFCQWFFRVLNSHNPSLHEFPQEWGPQHFWENAELKLHSLTDREQTKEFYGAAPVSQYLLSLVREEQLLFSPTLESHGLKCEGSAHGLVVVAVAGTVHHNQKCLGIFEQQFGLIRSPQDNNWKIKYVHIKVRGQREYI